MNEHEQVVTIPPVRELWAIRVEGKGHLLPPMDDDGTACFICWPSKQAAEVGLKFQQEHYDVEGKVYRLF